MLNRPRRKLRSTPSDNPDGALQERSRLILRSASSAEGGGRSRQVENDPCPDAELALDAHLPAHHPHEPAADRQPEPGPPVLARRRGVGLGERLEDRAQLLLGDPDPRVLDGKPDLSGVYDTGTLTPLNRPKEFADKQFMSAQQAEQILAMIKKRYEVLTQRESTPDRGAPKKGGDGNNSFGAGGVGGYNGFFRHSSETNPTRI